jgi:hypothetical protein
VQHEDDRQNVYALFPGIDTAPFGRAADVGGLSDDGWSGTVESTIELGSPPRPQRRWTRRAVGAWLVVAVSLGAGLAVARALLDRSAPLTSEPTLAAVQTHASARTVADVRNLTATHLTAYGAEHRTAGRPSVRESGRDHGTGRRQSVRAMRPALTASVVHGTPVSSTSETQLPTTSDAGVETPNDGQAVAESNNATATSAQDSRPAGPSGPVSLIGAGTTPSG